MQESEDPEAPEFWFAKTMERFDEKIPDNTRVSTWENQPKTRRERLDLLWDYLIGNPPLPYVNEKYKSIFEKVMRKARINYPLLTIEAMVDRSKIASITTESDADFDGDDFARSIHDISGFEAMHSDLQTWLYTFGEVYAQVIPPVEGLDPTDAPPLMVAEDPRHCVGIKDPTRPGRLRSWVKVYDDMILDQQVAVFCWGGVKKYARRTVGVYSTTFTVDEWDWSTEEGEGDFSLETLAELGGVPVVLFENKMGMGEFEPHIDLLDRITDEILQLIVIQWYQSFRQRAVIGDIDGGQDVSDDDQSDSLIRAMHDGGEELKNLFEADPGALWIVPENVKFWESGVSDLLGPLKSISDNVKAFASVTRTPLVMFNPDGANQTATGAETMKESHIDKVRDRQSRQAPGMVLLHKIAFALAGEEARSVNVKVLWGALSRVPLETLGQFISQTKGTLSRKTQLSKFAEFTPEEVKRNETELAQEAMMAQTLAVTAAPAGGDPAAPAAAGDPAAAAPADATGDAATAAKGAAKPAAKAAKPAAKAAKPAAKAPAAAAAGK